MLLTINPDAPATLHEQLLGGLRGALARGDLSPGERLPAARDLAASLEVNVHTVLKAYAQLRDEGLIQMRRGRGAAVLAAPEAVRVEEAARRLLAAGAAAGLTLTHLHEALDRTAAATPSTTTALSDATTAPSTTPAPSALATAASTTTEGARS